MVTNQTRRTLLKAALFGSATPFLPFGCASTTDQASEALIGCAIRGRDAFSVVVADQYGKPIRQLPLPDRGHGIATSTKHRHAVAFARRPGEFFMVFDYHTGEIVSLHKAQDKRHYYGHGVYSLDQSLLFATEGERGTSRGIIGVYDVQKGYKKIAEFTGFGLGPHEVIIMPDSTLAIGVGGVHTNGREPLNLSEMKPSLSYVNHNGELVDQVSLPDHHLSIRHLAHDGSKTVLCGQQYRGEPDEYPALLAMHTAGGEMQSLEAEPEQWARFNHYIASIAATSDWILATSPRGSCYGIWSKQTRRLVELAPLPDASGVVVQDQAFRISSGAGNVVTQPKPQFKTEIKSGIQWDNHWSSIG
ncbi:DUF1513 domain-containing protein [Vibrio intestinalis]|uniref:DUF1513 domain-containing protein n=1 Tax=Vibrio intestinalis TaxID=2933291 RepID=UPI0021A42F01|nr:DUF1513 domain-containing protein [Vibrio intestinalis]